MLSARLKAIVDALPLKPGLRVLEIGCGPGAAAREVAARIGSGYVLGIDRSPRAIAQAVTVCAGAPNLSFRVALSKSSNSVRARNCSTSPSRSASARWTDGTPNSNTVLASGSVTP